MTRREMLQVAPLALLIGCAPATAPTKPPQPDVIRKLIYRWEGPEYGWKSGAWMQCRMYELKPGDLIAYYEPDDDGKFHNPPQYGRVESNPRRVPPPCDWEIMFRDVLESQLPRGVVPCR